jgi:hypothetical protein
MEERNMEGKERLEFLIFYRKELLRILEKVEKEIIKAGGGDRIRKEVDKNAKVDLTDMHFLESYVENAGLIDALKECREYLKSLADEEAQYYGRLHYSDSDLGKHFAMIAVSKKHINLYFAPNLGLYEKLPEEVANELNFGKSAGDKWDKFQLSSPRQVKKAISFLSPYLGAKRREKSEQG